MSVVAIVGRPNVGKSTLFNRLIRRRAAIVEDVPGVTRDRHYGVVDWEDRTFTLIDTGGMEPEGDELTSDMADQARQAVEEADLILFVVDTHLGLMPGDHEIASFLRSRAGDVLVVANKVDGPNWETSATEFYSFGFTELFQVSAEHKLGIGELEDAIVGKLPEEEKRPELNGPTGPRVAVLGRPNVGKSSLVNKIVGSDRLIVSPIAGTTRDAIDSLVERDGCTYTLIDTAGIRRKSKVERGVERWSVLKSFKAVDRADVCLILIDGSEGLTDQDTRIIQLAARTGRAMVLCVNKWDIVEKDEKTFDAMAKELKAKLGPFGDIPVLSMSALTGQRVERIFAAVDKVYENWQRRISTSRLNKFLEDCTRRLAPPVIAGKRARIYYITQVRAEPPIFAAFTSFTEGFPTSYERFIINRLRAEFDFNGVPLVLQFRKRSRRDEEKG